VNKPMFHEPSGKSSLMMRMQIVLKMSAFFPILPLHMAGSPTQISCTQSPCTLQIIQILFYYKKMWTDSPDL